MVCNIKKALDQSDKVNWAMIANHPDDYEQDFLQSFLIEERWLRRGVTGFHTGLNRDIKDITEAGDFIFYLKSP